MSTDSPASLLTTRIPVPDGSNRMLFLQTARSNDDVHAAQWERHPNGDELVCLVSGAIDVVMEEPSGERVVPLEPFRGLVIPHGVWHRLRVRKPAVLLAVTRPERTEHRAVESLEWEREVFPHSELMPLADDLWVVRGQFPSSQLPRNMIVYRYGGDKLLLHSVVALEQNAMRLLESLGKPSIMMIPNWDHWAHIRAFKKRYPDLTVVCPAASRAKVEERLAVDATCEDFFPRHGMRFGVPAGMDPVEGVLELPLRDGRTAVVVNDLVTNVPHQRGLYGLLLRITGSSGRPRVIPIVRRRLKLDRPLIRRYLEELSRRPDIAVLTTSHGECITSNVSEVLADVARDLR